MTDINPAPAESATSLSEIINSGHEAFGDHEPHREAGLQPDAALAADDRAQPAPTAETPAPKPAPLAAPAPSPTPAPAAVAPATDENNPNHPFWYRKELKRQKDEVARLQREVEQARGRPAPQQPQTAPPPAGEQSDDPFAHVQTYVGTQLQQMQLMNRLERSEERLADKHGENTVDEIREWLTTRPDLEQWAMGQRDPWGAAHATYQREKLAAEIGTDPKAYEQRLREQILAELAAKQGEQPAPAPTPQMRAQPVPPPMASTTRSATPRDPGSGQFVGPTPINDIVGAKRR